MAWDPPTIARNCQSFATEAQKEQGNFYVASIFVGSGECHVVRQGDISVLVDAGVRCPGVPESTMIF